MHIRAYFDDSGKESSPTASYVCMAGYLANESYWINFDQAWHQRLMKHGISCIHMKDLIPLQGDYKQLGWDAPKRGVVLADFVNVIKFSHLVGFGVGVDAEAWRDLRSLYPKLDNVQTFCFARIMRMVIDRMKISATRDQVALHFDSDPEFGAARLRLLSELGKHDPDARTHLGSITFGSMRTILPLQAADLLAWETRKELIQKTGGFSSTGRFSNLFTALGDIQLDYQSELWDRAEIETRALDILGIKRVPATPDAT